MPDIISKKRGPTNEGIRMTLQKLYCGIDVGSTAVRVGLYNDLGTLQAQRSHPIAHHISTKDHRFVTQSSTQIWEALQSCLEALRTDDAVIASYAIAATCSVVVTRRVADKLCSYPANYGFTDPDQNVIFWMDTRAEYQTKQLNESLQNMAAQSLDYLGGSFTEEMALPKVKYILDNAPSEDVSSLVFFDLHDYLSYKLGKTSSKNILASNSINPVGIDGEVKGWSKDLLHMAGMAHLHRDGFKAIGCLEDLSTSDVVTTLGISPIPLAGSIIGWDKNSATICQGVIDSYGGWLGSCGKELQGTLTMVAGTSTCFIVGHTDSTPLKGIWGPFNGLVDSILVSEGGQATTGKLIEHLFETHPAYEEVASMGPNVFASIENLIVEHEKSIGSSIHYSAKHMFMYGELSGNRTPYADASLRGVFFGESTDISVKDFVLKYVCILECLAFQTRHVVHLMSGYTLRKIVICGSQAKNLRFVDLLARVTGLPVEVNNDDPSLSGIKGAFYLAFSGHNQESLMEVVKRFNKEGTIHHPPSSDQKLTELLITKYVIMLDIAQRQMDYKKRIDSLSQ